MAEIPEGAAGRHIGARPRGLSALLIRLDEMSAEDLRAADPIRAARWFKVNPNHAAGYIRLEQERRGLPVIAWSPVEYQCECCQPKGPPPPTDAQMVKSVISWGPGDCCAHGLEYPGPCRDCEDALLRARGPSGRNFHRRAPARGGGLYDD
jgi:hypothetical protein